MLKNIFILVIFVSALSFLFLQSTIFLLDERKNNTLKNENQYYDLSSAPKYLINTIKELKNSGPRVVLGICCGYCGGTADRIRGLVFLLSLAERLNASLSLHSQYIFGPQQNCGAHKFYNFRQNARIEIGSISELDIKATSNWGTPIKGSRLSGICGSYKCGNLIYAIINQDSVAKLKEILSFSELLSRAFWPSQSVVSIHVRTGGSFVRGIGSLTPWKDGNKSNISQSILQWVKDQPRNFFCSVPLYIATDSSRFIAELRHHAPLGLKIVHCCTQPYHMGLQKLNYGEFQQIFDIAMLYKSKFVFSTTGGFSSMSRTFFGFSEKATLYRCKSATCSHNFLNKLIEKLSCKLM